MARKDGATISDFQAIEGFKYPVDGGAADR
jgi:hypothetical protein